MHFHPFVLGFLFTILSKNKYFKKIFYLIGRGCFDIAL
jgi:hypothetical protein